MTGKQIVLKMMYPLIMKFSGGSSRGRLLRNSKYKEPKVSFYELIAIANDNSEISFNDFKGKKVILVNTASNCGFTGQYSELQRLHQKYPDIIIVGFPSNDFKEQEKGSDTEIAEFCQTNFGVTFPLAKKSRVIRGENQNPIFNWLSDPEKNGWNKYHPDWNFSKYLINEQGVLTNYFGPAISPLSSEVFNAIEDSQK
jgi:glutathione peroxidase